MDDPLAVRTRTTPDPARRKVLLGGAAAAAATAWVAPTIISVPAASAATCFVVPPELALTDALLLAAPSGPSEDQRDSAQAFVWYESGEVALAAPLAVDATTPGFLTLPSTTSGATIPAGTVVFSYYVHFRPVGSDSAYNTGSITIPAGYSFGGIAFRASGAAPVSPAPCSSDTSSTLRTSTGLGNPAVTYTYCSKVGQGYEDTLYSANTLPPPAAWATLPTPVVRDTVIVSGTGPTTVTWYCFTGFVNSDDFRLLIIPDPC